MRARAPLLLITVVKTCARSFSRRQKSEQQTIISEIIFIPQCFLCTEALLTSKAENQQLGLKKSHEV
jgi:hypothetical protein